MAATLQTTFSKAFLWKTFRNIFVFWFNFYLRLFQRTQLTMRQHQFRYRLGAVMQQATTWLNVGPVCLFLGVNNNTKTMIQVLWKIQSGHNSAHRQMDGHTVECRYNAVQYNIILPVLLKWLRQNINESLKPQKTLYISSWRASYRLSLVMILEKINRVITAPHCIRWN